MSRIVLSSLPSIGAIQRTTAILTALVAAVMGAVISLAAATGCLVGGALMIANLYTLSVVGRALMAIANSSGGATRTGIVVAPLKMGLIIGVVYLIVASGRVDIAGFMAGILTQFAAIFIETWRVSKRGGRRVSNLESG